MLRTARKQNATGNRTRGTAPLRRPGAVALRDGGKGRDGRDAYTGNTAKPISAAQAVTLMIFPEFRAIMCGTAARLSANVDGRPCR